MLLPTLRTAPALRAAAARRTYATGASPNTLILLEHRDSHLVPATLNAITAARKLGGTVTGLIVGEEGKTDGAIEQAKK